MDVYTDKALYHEAIKKFSDTKWAPTIVYLSIMLTMLITPLSLYKIHQNVSFVISFFSFGLFQYYAIIATHEAIHYGLLPNKILNNILGTFMAFITTFNFAEIKKGHLAHHKWLGSPLKDPDYLFYIKDHTNDKIKLYTIFFRPIVGLLKLFQMQKLQKPLVEKIKYKPRKNLFTILLFQIVFILILGNFSFIFGVIWMCSIVTLPGFLMHIRLILEHSSLITKETQNQTKIIPAKTHSSPSQLLPCIAFNFFRVIFMPFSFNYHHEHHSIPSIPYYNLHKVNKFLLLHEYYKNKKENISFSIYSTFKKNIIFFWRSKNHIHHSNTYSLPQRNCEKSYDRHYQ